MTWNILFVGLLCSKRKFPQSYYVPFFGVVHNLIVIYTLAGSSLLFKTCVESIFNTKVNKRYMFCICANVMHNYNIGSIQQE